MRLKVGHSKLHRSQVGTVVARSAEAVGSILHLEVHIEGCAKRAVLDTGAQSTIMSRDSPQSHYMYARGGTGCTGLGSTKSKLYGHSGADCNEWELAC